VKKTLAVIEGALYLALGITLASFDVPLWARVLVVSCALAIAGVSNARVRLERQDGARSTSASTVE
jgi:hypothetical protein